MSFAEFVFMMGSEQMLAEFAPVRPKPPPIQHTTRCDQLPINSPPPPPLSLVVPAQQLRRLRRSRGAVVCPNVKRTSGKHFLHPTMSSLDLPLLGLGGTGDLVQEGGHPPDASWCVRHRGCGRLELGGATAD